MFLAKRGSGCGIFILGQFKANIIIPAKELDSFSLIFFFFGRNIKMKEKIRKCRKEVKEIVVLPVCQGIVCFFGHLGFLLKFSGKEKK